MPAAKEFEAARRKRSRRAAFRRLRSLVIFCALVAVILAFARYLSEKPILNIIKTNLAISREKGSFPVRIPGEKMFGLTKCGNGNIAVFSDKGLFAYDGKGRKTLEVLGGTSDMISFAYDDDIIYYGSGGKKVYIQNVYGASDEIDLEGKKIVSVCVSGDGKIAVLSQKSNYISQLDVYDKSLKPFFSVQVDANDFAVSAAFTADSRGILIVSCKAEGGQLCARMTEYAFDGGRVVFESKIKDLLPFSAEYHNMDIILVGDKKTLTLNRKGEIIGEYAYQGKELVDFDNKSQDGAVLALGSYGAHNSSTVLGLDHKCGVQMAATLDAKVTALKVSQGKKYLLLKDSLVWYNKEGAPEGNAEINSDCFDFLVEGNNAYILTANQLQKIELKKAKK
ncbi:MAG: hypothetical protein LBC56_06980 [Oscillospiraceae bacterium]|jgi:hypothetical protein|nr:hypothetical protein [Oscillospiraceae bacterium]